MKVNSVGLKSSSCNFIKNNNNINFGLRLKPLSHDTVSFKGNVRPSEISDRKTEYIEQIIKFAKKLDSEAKDLAEDVIPRANKIKSDEDDLFKKVTGANNEVRNNAMRHTGETAETYVDYTQDIDGKHFSIRERALDPLTEKRVITIISEKDAKGKVLSKSVFREGSLLACLKYNDKLKRYERFSYFAGSTPCNRYFEKVSYFESHLGGQEHMSANRMLGFSQDNKLKEFKKYVSEEGIDKDIYTSYPREGEYSEAIFYDEEGNIDHYILRSETKMDCTMEEFRALKTRENTDLKTTNRSRLDFKDGKPYRYIDNYTTITKYDGTSEVQDVGQVYELKDGKWLPVDSSGFLSEL